MEDPYLSELASLASTTLAIALAYLNLDRFRYRQNIRDHARKALDLLRDRSRSVDKDHEDKGIYQGLRFLAMLGTPPPKTRLKEIIPSLRLRQVYPWTYASNRDRWFTTFCVIYSMFVLFVGRASGIGVSGYSFFASNWFLWPSYAILVLGIIVPVFLVLIGNWIRESAYSKIDHDRVEMEKFMKDIGKSVVFNANDNDDDDEPL